MRHFAPSILALVLAGSASITTPLRAQTSSHARHDTTTASDDDDESKQVPPRIATGVTAGAMRFAGGRTENAMSVMLLLRPLPWLKLSTSPGFGHTSYGNASSSGLTDIPFSAAAVHAFDDVTWSPSIAGGLSTTYAPSDSSTSLGLGRSSLESVAALGLSPTDRFDLSAEATHPLTANSGNGSITLESSMSFGRTTGTLGLSAEVGSADSAAVLSRSVAAGIAYSLAGPLTLTVDGSHGLSGSAPAWALSIGVGTAYAGVSPLSPTSAFKRLKSALGGKTVATSGYSKGACRRGGTC
ncbi:MAG: hypothetical protein M3Z10_14605 [Gemmatimonadota bacterium]|nr:hypothetical protein [Gemmatimonadota bacterium]